MKHGLPVDGQNGAVGARGRRGRNLREKGVCSLVFAELLEERGNGVRRYFTAWLGSRGENGAGKARLCLRGREETRPHAAELGGVLGRGLGEEGGGGRVRRRGAQGAATGRNDAGRVPSSRGQTA